jgi:hypothetical protein
MRRVAKAPRGSVQCSSGCCERLTASAVTGHWTHRELARTASPRSDLVAVLLPPLLPLPGVV